MLRCSCQIRCNDLLFTLFYLTIKFYYYILFISSLRVFYYQANGCKAAPLFSMTLTCNQCQTPTLLHTLADAV